MIFMQSVIPCIYEMCGSQKFVASRHNANKKNSLNFLKKFFSHTFFCSDEDSEIFLSKTLSKSVSNFQDCIDHFSDVNVLLTMACTYDFMTMNSQDLYTQEQKKCSYRISLGIL